MSCDDMALMARVVWHVRGRHCPPSTAEAEGGTGGVMYCPSPLLSTKVVHPLTTAARPELLCPRKAGLGTTPCKCLS